MYIQIFPLERNLSMKQVNKVLVKLAKNVQDGNYYEAYQMYHSVSQRYVKQAKFDDALALLLDGIKNMMMHQQDGSALDLGERMVDILITQSMPVNDHSRGKISFLRNKPKVTF
jgi:hypothetical protein